MTQRTMHHLNLLVVGGQSICWERPVRLIDPRWLQGPVPSKFWHEKENRRKYLLWLGHRLRFRHMIDWYRLTLADIIQNCGRTVASYWRSSPFQAVQECFPRYEWWEWLFLKVSNNFWTVRDNRLRYMRWLQAQLGYRRVEDWYGITEEAFRTNHGKGVLTFYGGRLAAVVKDLV